MKIYLVQHGPEQSKAENSDKPLTEEGIKNVEKIAQFLASNGLKFEGIYYSDKLRARQTANILGTFCETEFGVHESDHLGPNDDIEVWIMRAICSEGDPVIVGHLPHLDRLASKLVAKDETKQVVNFQKGGVVCLEGEEEEFSVKWVMLPELLS